MLRLNRNPYRNSELTFLIVFVLSSRFVTFSSEEEAEKAISMYNSTRIDGHTFRVDYTKSFKEQKAQSLGMFSITR